MYSLFLLILSIKGSIPDPKSPASDLFDLIDGGIALVYVLIFIVTVIFFARWIYVANYNVRALGAQGLRMTPAGAVGYFFVPIVNLWLPYQAMKDLWRASQNPLAWQTVKAGPILGIWWFLWIAVGLIDMIALRLSNSLADVLLELFYIALCLAAFTLVSQIQAAQQKQKLPEASPEPAAVPPPL